MQTCSIPDCDRVVLARGWCSTHYYRWYRHGSPDVAPIRLTFEARLASSVDVADCWLWNRARKGSGYGNVNWAGRWTQAHRWVWENLVGPVPSGMHLDHLCRVRHCVNPDHLEVVTPAVNAARSAKAVKRWCIRGHDLWDEKNVYRSSTGRTCRACHAWHERNRRARARTAEMV